MTELTPEERKDIEDDVTFRVKTSVYLKQQSQLLTDLKEDFKSHCNTSEKFRTDVTQLKTHRTLQWFFISGIIFSVLWFKFM